MRHIRHFRKVTQNIYQIVFLIYVLALAACGGGVPDNVEINNASFAPQVTFTSPSEIKYTEHDGKVHLSWSSVKGAERYRLYLSTQENIDKSSINSDHTTVYNSKIPKLVLSDIERNTSYYAILSSINEEDEELSSPEFKVLLTSDKIVLTLDAPSNFSTVSDEGKIQLSWDPLPEAVNYILYYSTNDSSVSPIEALQIREIGGTSFTHENLDIEKDYYYRLSAVTPAGFTPLTDVLSGKPKVFTTSPKSPDQFSASAGDGFVALKWQRVENAASYTIYIGEGVENTEGSLSDGPLEKGGILSKPIKISDVKGISTNRFGLENNKTFYFSISSVNTIGESEPSPIIAATPKFFLPTVPKNVKVKSEDNEIEVSWDPVVDAINYTVYWSTEPDADRATANAELVFSGTEFSHKALTTEDVIYYFVTATNENGESEEKAGEGNSARVSAIPIITPAPLPPPLNFRITESTDGVNFTWNDLVGAEEFIIYLATETGITKDNYFEKENGARLRYIFSTDFIKKGLLPGTKYFFRIASVNKGGEGGLSPELSFITAALGDTTPPTLLSSSLDVNNTSVQLDASFSFTFSETLDQDSVTDENFSLYLIEDDTNVEIDIAYNGNQVDVTPLVSLLPGETYELQLSTGLKDAKGNNLTEAIFFTITTLSPPIITLNGGSPFNINQFAIFSDPGVTALDVQDGDISSSVVVGGTVNTNLVGQYILTYDVTDSDELSAVQVQRIVNVIFNNPPEIALLGDSSVFLSVGEVFNDPGASAVDAEDGNISSSIEVSGVVDTNVEGTYTLTYQITDSLGKTDSITRNVNVSDRPVITVTGDNPFSLYQFQTFSDPGVTAVDSAGANISGSIVTTGSVNTDVVGSYTLLYTVTDGNGIDAVQQQRTVNVLFNNPPSLTLSGADPLRLAIGSTFIDPGATATDAEDGNLTTSIVESGTVDTGIAGTYIRTYQVSDSLGKSDTITRNVVVTDLPIITVQGDNPLSLYQFQSFSDPGATAVDSAGNDITAGIITTGSVDANTVGNYTLFYNVSDGEIAAAEEQRVVNVLFNNPPGISLIGSNTINLAVGDVFNDPGASATDAEDGNITANIVESGGVNTSLAGTYTRTYQITDSLGKSNSITRTVVVANRPVISVTGANPLSLYQFQVFNDPGATAVDDSGANISNSIVQSGSVNVDVVGDYTLRYNVSDENGIAAVEQQRIVNVLFNNPPNVSLIGSDTIILALGDSFTDPGASATDAEDGNITANIVESGSVNTAVSGTYTRTYQITDSLGKSNSITRTIVVSNLPVINITGTNPLSLYQFQVFNDPGATATDAVGNNISGAIVTTGSVNVNVVGSYTLRYNVSDSNGIAANEVQRVVNVLFNNPPTINLIGDNPINLLVGDTFVDPGATVNDIEDGDTLPAYTLTGSVDTNNAGTYVLTYRIEDSLGKFATVTRTVVVASSEPIISLVGVTPMNVYQFEPFNDPGATAFDAEDGDISNNIVPTGSVNTATIGTYTLRYNVTDSDGVAATELQRIVNVIFNNPPSISLIGSATINLAVGDAFADPGASATDAEDGNITANIVESGVVNTAVAGSYTRTYTITDSLGKTDSITRTVVVANRPVITVTGDNPFSLYQFQTFTDPAVTAVDSAGTNITANIVTTGSVNTGVVGSYTLRYNVDDGNGIAALEVQRVVNVLFNNPPNISLIGSATINLAVGDAFADPGASATDAEDGNITANIVESGAVNTAVAGSYTRTYTITDSLGKNDSTMRTFVVSNRPVITLQGDNPLSLYQFQTYSEPGATAFDIEDGDLTIGIERTGTVNTAVLGVYTFRYNVSDSLGIAAIQRQRTVEVIFNNPPTITILGDNPLNISQGTAFSDPGATANDTEDGNLTGSIVRSGSVNTAIPGTYTRTYQVTDSLGKSDTKTRSVIVTASDASLSSIAFADANLRTCVLGTGFTLVSQLTSLDCSSLGISDISGIENLTALQNLTLFNNAITDISPLAALANLSELNLGRNKISSIYALDNLNSLTRVIMNNNFVVEVSPLYDAVGLLEVNFQLNIPLTCGSIRNLDMIIDGALGTSTGVVIYNLCGTVLDTITFDRSVSEGWRSNGLAAGDTGVLHSPNPSLFQWDDSTQYPLTPGTDGINNNGSLHLSSDNFLLPTSYPSGVIWSVDLISPDLTFETATWQTMNSLSLIATNRASNGGGIWIQPLVNATRLSDGATVFLREEDGAGNPVFHSLIENSAWDESIYVDFGDLSGYTINNIRMRVFGDQTSGPLSINIDNIQLNPPPS